MILRFIKALAEYEKMADQVVATEELLREWIFEKGKAEVLFACEDDIQADRRNIARREGDSPRKGRLT